MLNKDEYNQDEYNNYYAQEVRGAEISGGDNKGSSKKMIIILLLLLLIVAVGYFGWKSMNGSSSGDNSTSKAQESIQDKDTEIATSKESTQADKIAKQIENSDVKMTSEDVAKVVRMVMMNINKDKSNKESTVSTPSSTATPEEQEQDSQLMESLSDAEVDSLSSLSDGIDSISDSDNQKQATTLSKDTDIYNKVVLKESASDSSDDLSKLSDEISSVVDTEDLIPTTDNDYTASITKEVETRKQEMRYIIIKEGDTLGKIAKKYYGNVMEYKKIYQANPDILRRPDKIYIGQRVRIP